MGRLLPSWAASFVGSFVVHDGAAAFGKLENYRLSGGADHHEDKGSTKLRLPQTAFANLRVVSLLRDDGGIRPDVQQTLGNFERRARNPSLY